MGVIIKDIKKTNNEIIRIEVSEFKGRELINLRTWFLSIDNDGNITYKPTQKGITLNISQYEELRDGVERVGQYIKDRRTGFNQRSEE